MHVRMWFPERFIRKETGHPSRAALCWLVVKPTPNRCDLHRTFFPQLVPIAVSSCGQKNFKARKRLNANQHRHCGHAPRRIHTCDRPDQCLLLGLLGLDNQKVVQQVTPGGGKQAPPILGTWERMLPHGRFECLVLACGKLAGFRLPRRRRRTGQLITRIATAACRTSGVSALTR